MAETIGRSTRPTCTRYRCFVPARHRTSPRSPISASPSPRRQPNDIIREGEAGSQCFAITSSVDVLRGKPVASLGPGDHFGELALFDPSPRNATVVATSDTTLVSLSRNSFWELLGEVGSLRDVLLTGMAHRLHELDGRV